MRVLENLSEEQRTEFQRQIDVNGPTLRSELGPCHVWTGRRNNHGYGYVKFGGQKHMAHRVAWALEHGKVPLLCVMHKCDGGGAGCVRIDHLQLGTHSENSQDMVAKGRNRSRFKVGEAVHSAKLSDLQVDEIRQLSAAGASNSALAIRFGVSHHNIWLITSGRSRTRAASHDHVLSDRQSLGAIQLLDRFVTERGGSHTVTRVNASEFGCAIRDCSGVTVADRVGTTPDNARFALAAALLKGQVTAA